MANVRPRALVFLVHASSFLLYFIYQTHRNLVTVHECCTLLSLSRAPISGPGYGGRWYYKALQRALAIHNQAKVLK